MPLLGDVLAKFASGDELNASEIDKLRISGNLLDRMGALASKIDPVSGDVLEMSAGSTELRADGVVLHEEGSDAPNLDETIRWETRTGLIAGSLATYLNSTSTTGWLDLTANGDHAYNPAFANGMLELSSQSNGSTSDWSSWIFLWASGDATGDEDVVEFTFGKAGSWKSPFLVRHNFTSRETVFILDCRKTTTGDPTGSEGMFYYNTVDNVIKMYADGAWRTLASW